VDVEGLEAVRVVRRRKDDLRRTRVSDSTTPKPSSPGIWTSRKTRSGSRSSIRRTASTPFFASPTTSTSWELSEVPSRSRSRASFSSSTMIVRIMRCR
jgi:hypothetical protein